MFPFQRIVLEIIFVFVDQAGSPHGKSTGFTCRNVEFEIQITRKESIGENGFDNVEFMISIKRTAHVEAGINAVEKSGGRIAVVEDVGSLVVLA